MKNVTYFTGFNKPVKNISLQSVIQEIIGGIYKNEVDEIRKLIDEGKHEEAQKKKKQLLAFTPSASFTTGRKPEFIDTYSQYIVLDFDKLSEAEFNSSFEKAKACKYTYACFRSPGGNGMKVLVCVSSGQEDHLETFNQVKDYYEQLLQIKIDPSGKDITRLCYVSYDPNAFLNEQCQIFSPSAIVALASPDPSKALFENCLKFTNKKKKYSEGNRNNYIHLLASNCNRKGLSEKDTLNFIITGFDLPHDEIITAVTSAYSKTIEHNTDTFEEDKPKLPVIDLVEKYLTDRYEFRYNVVTGKIEYKSIGDTEFQNINDYIENSLHREIQKARLKCNITTLRGILGSDFCEIYNPFLDYFKGLPGWDKTTDHISALANTITTTDPDYWQLCFKKWLVGMVGTAIDDKTINHTVIVFTGKQGVGKTTWVENLVPKQLKDHLFSGTINPNNKDTLIHLSECMLINLDELENLNKSEIGALKELITKSHIRIRKAYGHNNEGLPRRASFAGSVNTAQFLNDSTGSRRFLCHEVIEIEYHHSIELSKVYAQALHLYKTGFKFWFDKNEIDVINQNNEQYQMKSLEEDALQIWFEKPSQTNQTNYLTTSQIASKLAIHSKLQVNNSTLNLLGKALRKQGYERIKKGGIFVYALYERNYDEVESDSKNISALGDLNSHPQTDDPPF
ncbi:MAG: VapE family protein [Bacteroidota bacterium]|nr:VapE family protein [Bacteroidota bacterium]